MIIIERITYKKIFPLGSYVNESIGVEVLVTDDQDPTEIFQEAKALVESWGTKPPNDSLMATNDWIKMEIKAPTIPVVNRAAERLKDRIEDASSLEELEKLFEEANKYGLHDEYFAKLKLMG